ncbi:hypothetical protein [Spirosoma pollinicola]|uniref:Uncharacterized protein n=1 Tax=Spirosoma pollinicola TaxID=2057025 RepID=A0A2K8Z4I7_9BACT|nr:hypothetical protein [Spirosoma pollinicola]AUD04797.1 hypothetical protein CWM47_24935 [Spirosoma pollinicola]
MTVEEASVENIFHEMGYASSTDYAIKKAREELLHELKISVEAIAVFEKKYGMSYEEFYSRFNELTQFGLFEREDDSMDWRAELTVLRGVEKRLTWLTK